jgi:hypothetical protein
MGARRAANNPTLRRFGCNRRPRPRC